MSPMHGDDDVDEHSVALRMRRFHEAQAASEHIVALTDRVKCVTFATPNVDMHYEGAELPSSSIHRATHPSLRFTLIPGKQFIIVFPEQGRIKYAGTDVEVVAEAGAHALLLPAAASGKCVVDGDWRGQGIVVASDAVAAQQRRIGGAPIPAMPRDVMRLEANQPALGALGRAVASIFHEVRSMRGREPWAFAKVAFDDMLIGLATAAIASAMVPSGAQVNVSGLVSRATREMQRDLSEPIVLGALATRLGVSLRALQVAFQRDLGVTPREYLLKLRLDDARSRILAAGDNARVSDIAFSSGFTDLGYFAQMYRRSFGELPSDTLRRQRD